MPRFHESLSLSLLVSPCPRPSLVVSLSTRVVRAPLSFLTYHTSLSPSLSLSLSLPTYPLIHTRVRLRVFVIYRLMKFPFVNRSVFLPHPRFSQVRATTLFTVLLILGRGRPWEISLPREYGIQRRYILRNCLVVFDDASVPSARPPSDIFISSSVQISIAENRDFRKRYSGTDGDDFARFASAEF